MTDVQLPLTRTRAKKLRENDLSFTTGCFLMARSPAADQCTEAQGTSTDTLRVLHVHVRCSRPTAVCIVLSWMLRTRIVAFCAVNSELSVKTRVSGSRWPYSECEGPENRPQSPFDWLETGTSRVKSCITIIIQQTSRLEVCYCYTAFNAPLCRSF